METVTDFIFLDSKITVDGDYSHEIKRRLLLGRKAMTNLDSILKSRDITLPTKVSIVKATVFPLVGYRCESWTIKNGWVPQSWCLQTVVLEKTVESPWTARRSNQSILKEISPKYSLEGLMLKLQNFGHLMQSANSLEKTLMLGKIEGRKRREWQRMRWWWHHQLNGHEFKQAAGDGEGLEVWCAAIHVVTVSTTEWLNSKKLMQLYKAIILY